MATSRLFDPQALLNDNAKANATRRVPNPMGETVAQIMELSIDEGVSGPKSKNPGTPWARLNCKLEVTDPSYLATCPGNPSKVTMFLGVMLDMDGKVIASGDNKNIRLGKLREATGTNGKPLNSMMGSMIRISVGHKPHHEDPEQVVDEVTGYTSV